ncbi:cell division inhibitor SepF [Scopulibacillus daqui]|uniref:Cell division protein SepF n=1 Tax=Scopulibacillus daqui TaxID=1469162 RepID=A0ABS2PW49_9BACL|nr:cell division protein SepF [Scopulibacillus daqui]MBM7644282.1 cell division inhibitor SepF [Scopulibacillus daqui]
MGIKTTFKRFFDLDDESEEIVEEEYDHKENRNSRDRDSQPVDLPRLQAARKQNVVSLQSIHQQTKVILVEPRTFNDVENIAAHIKNRKTVVLNMQRIPEDEAQRTLDFLAGSIYALDGQMQKLGTDTFMCAPEHVDISGIDTEMLKKKT